VHVNKTTERLHPGWRDDVRACVGFRGGLDWTAGLLPGWRDDVRASVDFSSRFKIQDSR